MLEQWLLENAWWIIISVFGILGFSQFRKWNIEKFKEKSKSTRQENKEKSKMPDADVTKYIAHPEDSIAALKKQRVIFEKENDTERIAQIDSEIKMLGYLLQVPAPLRPYAANIGQGLMKKVNSMVEGAF